MDSPSPAMKINEAAACDESIFDIFIHIYYCLPCSSPRNVAFLRIIEASNIPFTLCHVLMFKSKDFLKLSAAELQHTFSRVFSEMLQCWETSKWHGPTSDSRHDKLVQSIMYRSSSVMCHLYLVKKLQLFELPIQQNGNCYFCGLAQRYELPEFQKLVLRPKKSVKQCFIL